jgi:hypothetical protein
VLNDRQVIEALLNKQSDNPVRVKYEVRPVGVFVSDHAREKKKISKVGTEAASSIGDPRQESNELGSLWQSMHILK